MDRRRLLGALATAGVAGCLRLAEDEGTLTRTPARSPTETHRSTRTDTLESTEADQTDTVSEVHYPVGLSEDGVSKLLADAHHNGLTETSFRLGYNRENISTGSTFESSTTTAAGERAFERREEGRNLQRYYSTSGRWWRVAHNDATVYGANDLSVNEGRLTKRDEIKPLFVAGEFSGPESVTSEGENLYRVTASGVSDVEPIEQLLTNKDISSIEGFSAEVLVTPDGTIRNLDAELQVVWSGELNAIKFELSTSDVGTTVVSDPEWLATARDRVPRVDVEVSDGRRYVVYSHTGGGPVPSNARVILHESGSYNPDDRRILSEPFESGQKLHVWREDGETRYARSEPSNANPVRLGADYITSLDVGVANYVRTSLSNV